MVVAPLTPLGPLSAARSNQPHQGATRGGNSAAPNASGECRRAAPRRPHGPIPCVPHGLAAPLMLLAVSALVAIFHIYAAPGSVASNGSPGGATSGTPAEAFVVGTTHQSEPEAVPTARIRYDIPGWDSIRRTSTRTDASAVEPLRPPIPDRLRLENLLVPGFLALLPPVLGWVGLSWMLRSSGRSPDASATATRGRPGYLLSGLHEMASKRAPAGCDREGHLDHRG